MLVMPAGSADPDFSTAIIRHFRNSAGVRRKLLEKDVDRVSLNPFA
jgi:hypothetical protein